MEKGGGNKWQAGVKSLLVQRLSREIPPTAEADVQSSGLYYVPRKE